MRGCVCVCVYEYVYVCMWGVLSVCDICVFYVPFYKFLFYISVINKYVLCIMRLFV